jgi:hypothetical protein
MTGLGYVSVSGCHASLSLWEAWPMAARRCACACTPMSRARVA